MSKFKVGDIVKVVSNGRSGSGRRYNGKIGKILKIHNADYDIYNEKGFCSLDIDLRRGGIYLSELELAEKIKPKVFGIVKFLEEHAKQNV
mgnify:CR=1 FL=1